MTALPDDLFSVAMHSLFSDGGTEPSELIACVHRFLDGDCGDITDEDEILGFLDRRLNGLLCHGAYETRTGGRVHIVGDGELLLVMPDLIFAQGTKDTPCSINTCVCGGACASFSQSKPTHIQPND